MGFLSSSDVLRLGDFPRKLGSSPRRRKTCLGERVRLGQGWFAQANPGAKLEASLISAQKVLFLTLFIASFEHFLCTNQRN